MATHYLNTKPKQTFTSNQSHSESQLVIRGELTPNQMELSSIMASYLIVDYLYGQQSLFFEHETMDMDA